MKQHLPVSLWESIFKAIESHNLQPEVVRRALGLISSTFYRKRRQYLSGGVLPRRPGSGRKRIYHAIAYEPMIREILREGPPVIGHRRVWFKLRSKGVPYSLSTSYRIVKELGLLVPHKRGRCHKHYEPLRVDGPGQLYVADTTTWWIRNRRVEIYLALDAHSRWIPGIMVSSDRTSMSTVKYYEQILDGAMPVAIHTDNGTEFTNRDARAYLEDKKVGWQHGPSHTPQAQGLVERVIKTMKEEWLMWREPKDEVELQGIVNKFMAWYNSERVHSALGYQTPEVIHNATK